MVLFSLSLKEDLQTLRPIEIGIFSTYLHAHMQKINSSSSKSVKVLAKFLQNSQNSVSKKISIVRSAVVFFAVFTVISKSPSYDVNSARLADVWLAWSFQANFMFKSVM